jgi:hypothetical protein
MIPIVYFHGGCVKDTQAPRHLQVSIAQTKKFNENVVLLGDKTNSHLNVNHYSIEDYSEGVDHFRSLYKHMSTNPEGFELKCIERWIVLANFVKKENLNKVIYLDSDIMTFCNYEDRESLFEKDYTAMVCAPHRLGIDKDSKRDWSVTGCVSFWNSDVIEKFKNFILEVYTDKSKLLEKWNWHIENKYFGGICDMTIMYLFYFDNNLGSLCKVQKDNSTFDQNYYVPENYFRDEYGYFENDKPTGGRNGKFIHWEQDKLINLNGGVEPMPFYKNVLLDKENGGKLIRVNSMPELARFVG